MERFNKFQVANSFCLFLSCDRRYQPLFKLRWRTRGNDMVNKPRFTPFKLFIKTKHKKITFEI